MTWTCEAREDPTMLEECLAEKELVVAEDPTAMKEPMALEEDA